MSHEGKSSQGLLYPPGAVSVLGQEKLPCGKFLYHCWPVACCKYTWTMIYSVILPFGPG